MCQYETTYWICKHHRTKVFECEEVKDRPFLPIEPCHTIEESIEVQEECEECKIKQSSREQFSRMCYGEIARQQSRRIARKLSTRTRSSGTIRQRKLSSGIGCFAFLRGHFSSSGTRKIKKRDSWCLLGEDSGVPVVGVQPQVSTPLDAEFGSREAQGEQIDEESLPEADVEVNELTRSSTPPPDFKSSSIRPEGRQDGEMCLPEHQLLVPSPAEKRLRMEREAVELFFSDYPTVMNPDTSFFVDSPAQIFDNPFSFKQPDASFFIVSPAQIPSNPFPFHTVSPEEPKVAITPTQPKASELPIARSFLTPALPGKANQAQPTVRSTLAPVPPPKVSLVESEAIELLAKSPVMTPHLSLAPSAMEPPEPCSEDSSHLRDSLISFPSLGRIQAALAYADEEQVSPPISPITTIILEMPVTLARPQTSVTQPRETFAYPATTFQQMELTGVNLNGAAETENSVPIMNKTLIPYRSFMPLEFTGTVLGGILQIVV